LASLIIQRERERTKGIRNEKGELNIDILEDESSKEYTMNTAFMAIHLITYILMFVSI
jgi:hypothetical protein